MKKIIDVIKTILWILVVIIGVLLFPIWFPVVWGINLITKGGIDRGLDMIIGANDL